jgi:hypothetical protein
MTAPALPEAWMRLAVCQAFPELPWLSDHDQVTDVDRLRMVAACRSCGAFERCSAFVTRDSITGGFWAGEFRDVPEDAHVPSDRAPVAS